MSDLVVELPTRRSTIRLARRLARALRPGQVVILSGPLGAGKTFLVRALCRALGLPADQRVTSPTFTLVSEYDTVPAIAHADVYRLNGASELTELGFDAYTDAGRVLLVEWGERFAAELGTDLLIVEIALDPRRATIRATGPEARRSLERLSEAPNGDGLLRSSG